MADGVNRYMLYNNTTNSPVPKMTTAASDPVRDSLVDMTTYSSLLPTSPHRLKNEFTYSTETTNSKGLKPEISTEDEINDIKINSKNNPTNLNDIPKSDTPSLPTATEHSRDYSSLTSEDYTSSPTTSTDPFVSRQDKNTKGENNWMGTDGSSMVFDYDALDNNTILGSTSRTHIHTAATQTKEPAMYFDDTRFSIHIPAKDSGYPSPSLTNYTINDDGNNMNDNLTDINTIIDTLNPTSNETFAPSGQYFVPEQWNSSRLDDYSTNYLYYSNRNWKENANLTINESFLHINDSIFLLPIYKDGSSPPFLGGIARIDTSPETITKVFVLALVSIFGSIGNFLVVGSVIKNRHLHRPPFYFLLSMGVTDLARAGFCLPVVMATALQGSIWRHGDTACKMFAFAASFFVFSSTLSLLVISVERHLSIVHAKAYRRRCHGFINLFATIFIWVTAFLVSFPPIFSSLGAGEYVFISEEAQCTYAHKHFSHNDGLNSVLTFVGISSLTLFLYYRIFVFMRSHRRMRPLQHRPAFSSTWTFVGPGANGQAFINWLNGFGGNASNAYQTPAAAAAATVVGSGHDPGSPTGNTGRAARLHFGRVVNLCTTKNEHLTRLFFIMTLVHGATWLPYVILSLWRVFLASSDIPAAFITYAAWLSYCQVAICPLAYFLSRGRSKSTSRVIRMEPAERNEFLLKDKISK